MCAPLPSIPSSIVFNQDSAPRCLLWAGIWGTLIDMFYLLVNVVFQRRSGAIFEGLLLMRIDLYHMRSQPLCHTQKKFDIASSSRLKLRILL